MGAIISCATFSDLVAELCVLVRLKNHCSIKPQSSRWVNGWKEVMKDGVNRTIDTDHEGYAVFDDYGNAAKLVDRKQFSKANFSDEYVKGWSK